MSRSHRLAALIVVATLVAPAASLAQAPAQTAPASAKTSLPATTVNLNTATVEQLDALPGIGPAMAARIIEYRQKSGAFKKVEELMNIRGIGEKNFLKLKPLITVGPVKTAAGSESK